MAIKKDFEKPCLVCGKLSVIQLTFSDKSVECYCNEHGIPEAQKQFQTVWNEMKGKVSIGGK